MHQKGKALAVGGLEAADDVLQRAEGHDQGQVGALVAHMHPLLHPNGGMAQLLVCQRLVRLPGQGLQLRGHLRQGLGILQRHLDRLLAHQALIGQAHAVGRQHTGQRMDQHPGHAERVGHQAGMLSTGAAKTLQGVARDVIAAGHRDLFDRIGHLLHRDANKALGHVFGAASGLRSQSRKFFAHHLGA